MDALVHAVGVAAAMAWQMLWGLILGFALSGAVQAVVSKREMSRLLPDDSPRSIATAAGLGAASSSCSYAAVALARSLFRKGADFTAAIAFEVASTNLVVELGVLLALLVGWQFTLAELVGGPLMIVMLAVLFRVFLRRELVDAAREQAERGVAGRMEGHAAMDDMAVEGGSIWSRLTSSRGYTATSHFFVMDWASIWTDILLGVLIAGCLAAWVPADFWRSLFFADQPTLAKLTGPILGPLVGIASFVCSVGNVPLAAVLWNGGISFGGVVAFIFADLIVLPVLNIYRKYYGWRMALFLLVTFYVTMVLAGYAVELLFGALGLIPSTRDAATVSASIRWDATTYLDLAFLLLAALLVVRFLRTGGPEMLRRMRSSGAEREGGPSSLERDDASSHT